LVASEIFSIVSHLSLKNAQNFEVSYPVFPFQLKTEAHPASTMWVF